MDKTSECFINTETAEHTRLFWRAQEFFGVLLKEQHLSRKETTQPVSTSTLTLHLCTSVCRFIWRRDVWNKGEDEDNLTIRSPSSKSSVMIHSLQNCRREPINWGVERREITKTKPLVVHKAITKLK